MQLRRIAGCSVQAQKASAQLFGGYVLSHRWKDLKPANGALSSAFLFQIRPGAVALL
jgi:hypothetical protein